MTNDAMPAAGSQREREIVGARVIVTSPGRNFVTLRLTTSDGVVGWVATRMLTMLSAG